MGYHKLGLSGDGDCFFHGVAAFELEREGLLPEWTGRGQGTFSDTFRAKELRRMVASAGVESLFPTWNLARLNDLFVGVAAPSDVTERIAHLPEPTFTGAVTQDALIEALPTALRPSWRNNPEERKRIAAFFLYWYQYSQVECQPKAWLTTSAYFGYNGCEGCIVGDIALNMEGHQQNSGFAAHLIYDLLAINLVVVRDGGPAAHPNTLAYLEGLPAPNDSYFYLVQGGHHFDAALWFEGPYPFAFVVDPEPRLEQSLIGAVLPRRFSAVSRRVNSSYRGSLKLGVGVWNINHLGEVPSRDSSASSADMAVDKTKNELKVEAVESLMARNEWLDIFTLNEVNDISGLRGLEGCQVFSGPHLISETEGGGSERKGQHEYYPLLLSNRPQRELTIEWQGCFCVDSKGLARPSANGQEVRWTKEGNVAALNQLQENRDLETFEIKQLENGAVQKTLKRKRKMTEKFREAYSKVPKIANMFGMEDVKSQPRPEPKDPLREHCVYRPVVVHQLLIDRDSGNSVQVNVGIIHTTPQGTEFERWNVYQQLNQFFDRVGTPEIDRPVRPSVPVYWIILGDFYLFGESRVAEPSKVPLSSAELQELYREELELRAKVAAKIEASQAQFQIVNSQLSDIVQTVERSDRALAFRLQRAGNQKALNPLQQYSKLLRACDPQAPATQAMRAKEPPSLELWELALSVDNLLQSLVPFDRGRRWADWWASIVPVCFREAADELDRMEVSPSCGKALADLRGGLEKIAATPQTADRIQLIKSAVESFNLVQKCLGERWQTLPSGSEPDDGGEREAHEPPLKYFDRNRKASAQRLNRFRNVLGHSFESNLKQKFQVLHTIWGTNIHGAAIIDTSSKNAEPKVEYSSFRIADFAVCSQEWRGCELGLFHHEREGLIRVDDKSVTTTVHWRALSDHFPVGGLFFLGDPARNANSVFIEDHDADFIEAKNVMYLQDILEGLYLFEEKPVNWKRLAAIWRSQKTERESSSKTAQEEREPGADSPYQEAFETRKSLLLERLEQFQSIDPEILERIGQLSVGADLRDVLLGLIRELAGKFPLRVSRAAASGGIWATGQSDHGRHDLDPAPSFIFAEEKTDVDADEYFEEEEYPRSLSLASLPPSSNDQLSVDYTPALDWIEWDAYWENHKS